MPPDLRKARELFLHAVGKLPPDEWDRYVAEACTGDADLAAQVTYLLQAHREAGSFLDSPAAGLSATFLQPATFGQVPTEAPGTQIGPYKLLQQIGEGGMGTVFMAEQLEPVQRKVALKVIKPGMDSRQIIARFEAERQALALMDHINIARVLDAGTTAGGRPYFVMELVHGIPITQYCDENHLTPRQRLELFVPVCQAIQHAHQKGIIHRDIKPSNVMVTLYDGQPVPKVIDFGVAKATEQKLTERTLFTQFGTMVGTLEYMSPEQAETSALGVDTRSDIYSLGVLLYELLTGSTPLSRERIREAAFAEVLRIIKEEEPPRPSTRLSDSGDQLASISAQRQMEPAKLAKLVQGELDWIVMKCLEKDRGRRYETANGFATDIQRYLADEPVAACPPSAKYRFGKFARRNRVAISTVMLVALALVLGTIVSTWQAIRAEAARDAEFRQRKIADAATLAESAQRRIAEREQREAFKQRNVAEANEKKALSEAAKATAVSELLQSALESANPEQAKGSGYTVRELLGDISANLGDQLAAQPEVEIELRRTIGVAYRRLGSPGIAELHFQRALDLARRVYGLDHDHVAEILVGYGQNLGEQYRYAEARQTLQEAVRIYRRNGTSGRALVHALWRYQIILAYGGREVESESIASEALEVAQASGADYPEVASILHTLAVVKIKQKQYAAAEELARRAVELHRRWNGNSGLETAWGLTNFGSALAANKKDAEAEAAFRDALVVFRQYYDGNHRSIGTAYSGLVGALSAQGKNAERAIAEREHEEWLHSGYGEQLTRATLKLSADLAEAGRVDRAIAGFRVALASNQRAAAELPDKTWPRELAQEICQAVAACLPKHVRDKSEHAESARELFRQALQAYSLLSAGSSANGGTLSPRVVMDSYLNMIPLLAVNPDWVAEVGEVERLFKALLAKNPSDSTLTRFAHQLRRFALELPTSGDFAAHKERALNEAAQIFEKQSVDHPKNYANWHFQADSQRLLGEFYSKTSKSPEAEKALRQAVDIFDKHKTRFDAKPINNAERAAAYLGLARLLLNADRRQEAVPLVTRAVEINPTMSERSVKLESDLLLGKMLRDAGKFNDALVLYDEIIAAGTDVAEPWSGRGDCYLALLEPAKAEVDFSAAIKVDPGRSEFWTGRANAYFHQHNWERAVADYSAAIDLNPKVHTNWYHRGHSYLSLAQWDKAAADFTKVVEEWPAESGGWYLRAVAYAQANQPAKAIADLRVALAKGHRDTVSLTNDARLDALRSHEEFKQLVRMIEKDQQ